VRQFLINGHVTWLAPLLSLSLYLYIYIYNTLYEINQNDPFLYIDVSRLHYNPTRYQHCSRNQRSEKVEEREMKNYRMCRRVAREEEKGTLVVGKDWRPRPLEQQEEGMEPIIPLRVYGI
jgi:hypothetical protein